MLITAPMYECTVSVSGCVQLFITVGIPARKSAAMAAEIARTPLRVTSHTTVPTTDIAPHA